MFDLAREIGEVLSHNRLRTALTGIAVTWGIFMLITLLGVARGVTNGFEENLNGHNTTMMRIFGGETSLPWKGQREGRSIDFKDGDLRDIPRDNPRHTAGVTARISGGSIITTPDGKVSQAYTGVFPDVKNQGDWGTLKQGRFINDRDLQRRAKVMVLPKYYAGQLFADSTKGCGGYVNVNGLSFQVVGIYESSWNRDVYIPFTTARMMSTDKSGFTEISVDLKDVKNMEDGTAAENGLRSSLARRHNFNPDDDRAVYIANYFNNALTVKTVMGILDTSVWVLGILTLLTGIVGVSNIMFVTVRERTHELGVRRAIGAKPRQILKQVIVESVSITLIFGYIGIVLGMLVTGLIAKMTEDSGVLDNPTVSLPIALEVTGVLVAAGALAGLFPALKALKVKPVEALRDE